MTKTELANVPVLFWWGVMVMSLLNCHSNGDVIVRKAAVGGAFYPAEVGALQREIHKHLNGNDSPVSPPQLMISPHAGYVYSGPVAGKGYATLDKKVSTVILIGPTHHHPFSGISIPDVDYYETPLGQIPLDTGLVAELHKNSLVGARPPAHVREHCLEVQLPFLQEVLHSFSIVPILAGRVDPEPVADLLLPFVNETTVVIASSDLAHVTSFEKCKSLDQQTLASIISMNISGPIEACGATPIRVVMHLATHLGLKPHLLDARNSQEILPRPHADYVVGYASIVFPRSSGPTSTRSVDYQSYLLRLARQALETCVKGGPPPNPGTPPQKAQQVAGCFVTLKSRGNLRGCIGTIVGYKPLYRGIIDNACNAALKDHRFGPVRPQELAAIKIEISVLTAPEEIFYGSAQDLLDKINAGTDGIILNSGSRQSTYLPQVWQQMPDKVRFLESLSLKGGMPKDGWKSAQVKRYHAVHFEEK
ncbi:MAG: AmmeMemoRadiSam system protein B [Chitinivibrionales bacterium]|nr:AmmeMemoRadiSam system protein B [Chitinivibrionales bacterium]